MDAATRNALSGYRGAQSQAYLLIQSLAGLVAAIDRLDVRIKALERAAEGVANMPAIVQEPAPEPVVVYAAAAPVVERAPAPVVERAPAPVVAAPVAAAPVVEKPAGVMIHSVEASASAQKKTQLPGSPMVAAAEMSPQPKPSPESAPALPRFLPPMRQLEPNQSEPNPSEPNHLEPNLEEALRAIEAESSNAVADRYKSIARHHLSAAQKMAALLRQQQASPQ